MGYGTHPRTAVVGICDLVQKSLDEVGDRNERIDRRCASDLDDLFQTNDKTRRLPSQGT